MATTIKLKSSAVSGQAPSLSNLDLRELALNTTDGKLYFRKGNGSGSDQIIDLTLITPGNLSTGGPYWDTDGNLTINTDLTIGSESVNTTGTSAATLISFSATTYRTVECTIQVTKGTVYHSTKLLIVHDGSDTYMTEYATITTGSSLASFSSDISSGNIIVTATPTDTTARTIKIQYSLLKT